MQQDTLTAKNCFGIAAVILIFKLPPHRGYPASSVIRVVHGVGCLNNLVAHGWLP
jgi:hypothetical protein